MSGIELAVLGPLEVRVDGVPVDIRRGIPRAIVVALVLRAREVVSAGALAEVLWGDDQPRNPVNALQIQVSYLRKRLGGGSAGQPVVTRPGGYVLMVDDDDIDARRFERLVRDAGRRADDDPAAALDAYEAALSLWRGEAFADVLGDPFVVGEATRLEELRLTAVEARNDVLLRLGRHDELVGELSGLVNEHPLRERLHAQLMLALYRSGRQADALRAYERARHTLVDEIGIDPGPELRRLEQQVLEQDPELDWQRPVAPAAAVPGQPSPTPSPTAAPAPVARPMAALPAPVTALVGRDVEIAKVHQLLGRSRVVTLTGPAGAGKSRLALEVARDVAGAAGPAGDGPPSEVWFVDLGPVDAPDEVAPSVAAALGVPVRPDEEAAADVATALAPRRGLLVLDTCEHVIAGAAALVARVLREAPDVRVLATSRRPLGVTGEIAWPVPPLALAPPDVGTVAEALRYPAVALFVDRAGAVRPDFELTEADLADVVAICLALDGLPLAIELAAARADVLSPGAIRERLEHRFDLLVDGARDVAARQQTLRAAVDWSADLLDDVHRRFFARLAVFPDRFDLDAATAVAADPGDDALGLLTDLVRQSMVTVPGPDQFRLLDTLRAYAAELLADRDADATSERHARYYLELAERAEVGIRGPDQLPWLAHLRAAAPQHRAALEWLLSTGDGEGAARLAGALGWFWVLDGRLAEARPLLDEVVAVADLPPVVHAKALWTAALVAGSLGELDRTERLARTAVELGTSVGDDASVGYGLNAEAVVAWALGRLDDAAALHERAIEHLERAGEVWGIGVCTVLRARTAIDAGDPAAADMAERALDAAQATGDAHVLGLAYEQLARVALEGGDAGGAAELALRALSAQESIGYAEGMLAGLHLLGRARLAEGRPDLAADHHRRALGTASAIGHAAGVLEAIDGLAAVAHATGDDELARRLVAVVETEREARHLPRRSVDCATFDALRAAVGADVGTPGQARRGSDATDLAAVTEELLRPDAGRAGAAAGR